MPSSSSRCDRLTLDIRFALIIYVYTNYEFYLDLDRLRLCLGDPDLTYCCLPPLVFVPAPGDEVPVLETKSTRSLTPLALSASFRFSSLCCVLFNSSPYAHGG